MCFQFQVLLGSSSIISSSLEENNDGVLHVMETIVFSLAVGCLVTFGSNFIPDAFQLPSIVVFGIGKFSSVCMTVTYSMPRYCMWCSDRTLGGYSSNGPRSYFIGFSSTSVVSVWPRHRFSRFQTGCIAVHNIGWTW